MLIYYCVACLHFSCCLYFVGICLLSRVLFQLSIFGNVDQFLVHFRPQHFTNRSFSKKVTTWCRGELVVFGCNLISLKYSQHTVYIKDCEAFCVIKKMPAHLAIVTLPLD